MTTQRMLFFVDRVSTWAGKITAWLIVGLMLVVCVEVFKRYILNAPTAWIFDLDNFLYGGLFMLCGAYTLAQDGHVRGDFLYGNFKPRTQAALDLSLYFLFFIPGILALLYAGWDYAALSWRIDRTVARAAEGRGGNRRRRRTTRAQRIRRRRVAPHGDRKGGEDSRGR